MRRLDPLVLFSTAVPVRIVLSAALLVSTSMASASYCLAQQATHPLPQALPGTNYAAQLAIPPGLGYPFAHCELQGQTPRWLTIDCARLQIKGKVPPAPPNADATYKITLHLEDQSGNTRSFPLAIRVSADPQVVNLGERDDRIVDGLSKDDFRNDSEPFPNTSNRSNKTKLGEQSSLPPSGMEKAVGGGPALSAQTPALSAESSDPTETAAKLSAAAAHLRPATLDSSNVSRPKKAQLRTSTPKTLYADPVPVVSSCEDRAPGAGGPPSSEDTDAVTALQSALKLCEGTKSPGCNQNLLALNDAIMKARSELIYCAEDGGYIKEPKSKPAVVKKTQDWYRARAALWADLSTSINDAQNQDAVSDGSYILPDSAVTELLRPNHGVTDLNASVKSAGLEHFGIAGVSIAAASSTSPEAKLFAQGYVNSPLSSNPFARWRGWGYSRIASISQTNLSALANQGSTIASTLSSTQVQQLVQSAELGAGLEFRVFPWSDKGKDSTKQFAGLPSVSFIAGGGALTPLSTTQGQQSTQAYMTTPDILLFYASYLKPGSSSCYSSGGNTFTKCTYVSFYPQDRSRFFRQYSAGVRLKFPLPFSPEDQVYFPGTFEASVGQNEYVTGGKFRGPVLHLAGETPLPYAPGLVFFGGMDLGVTGPGDNPAPLLTPSTGTPAPSSSNTLSIAIPQPNRDRYIMGVGFDIAGMVQRHLNSDKSKQNQ